jgi:EAL domain-containing protein (putative c-di-GMP-specific phosphodiesterase class I)
LAVLADGADMVDAQTHIRSAKRLEEFAAILHARDIRALFQPVVNIDDGQVVGYEALARGPVGSAFESPDALFGAAAELGRTAELDWTCRAAAFEAVLAHGESQLSGAVPLFLNCEPASFGTACPADLEHVVRAAQKQLHVVMEVTERDIARDPAALLSAVAQARDLYWGIALDDVGAEPHSMAMMPFINPDVIKLDLRLIQGRTTSEVAMIVNAVLAQAERTGATVLAEGIETDRHAEIARAMGATIGQGWLYGRPSTLPRVVASPAKPLRLLGTKNEPATATPFEVIAAHRATTRSAKELLIPMSMHLENKGLGNGEPLVVLGCFQEALHFTAPARLRFARLAERATFVGAVGAGMGSEPALGVRGANLDATDPLRGEWDVIVVGPHFAGALVARDCGDEGPDLERRFDAVITYDRDLVVEAARALLSTLIPAAAV